jgi:hypothetical protein
MCLADLKEKKHKLPASAEIIGVKRVEVTL